jgi:acyl carrier protein
MQRNKIRETMIAVAADIFSESPETIQETLRAGDTESWDSLGHLKLFMEVERQFGVKFSTAEILNLIVLKDIIDAIQQKLN